MLPKTTRLVWLSTLVLFGCNDAPQPTSLPSSEVAVARSVAPGALLDPAAPKLMVSLPDASGDMYPGTSIDVSQFDLLFDRTTGAYEITVRTYASGPFLGAFRVNVNFYNVDALSFFQDNDIGNEFLLTTPASTLKLAGIAPLLRLWQPGQRVHTNSLVAGTPKPPFSSMYRSAVVSLPACGFVCGEDLFAFPDLALPAIVDVFDASDQVRRLQDEINDWVAQGVLPADKAEGLLAKLAAILEKIERGQTKPASNQLSAFGNQVSAFTTAGLLSAEQAQRLLDGAAYAASQL